LRVANRDAALARGRTCYDHLAGRLGVLLLEAMTTKDLVVRETGLALTDRGVAWLAGLGVDVAALRSGRRPMTRDCLDWTERRPHLAGAAGAALCQRFFETGWIVRSHGSRAVRLTPAGLRGLNASLGITEQQLAA
jgi:hypothetical protein